MSDYTSSLEKILESTKNLKRNKLPETEYDSAIIMPPPNVTGNLHIGHALNLFLQDIIVRANWLNGHKIMWIPGTDHAGIATQLLVQKELAAKGEKYTTEELIQHIWEWKKFYENRILNQVKVLGVNLAWDHYLFTLDDGPQKGVVEAFCRLYEKGIIYRGNKILNWDIELQSVISDIESVNKELDAEMCYITYESMDGDLIEIATVRPETMFADVAILVHPDDDRYKHLVGKLFKVPFTERVVPIIADDRCEIDKGSGAVKIDPAHGFLDFEVGKEYNLDFYQIIDKHGKMCGDVPDWVYGLDRFAARAKVIQKLKDENLISKIDKIKNLVPHGARSNSILEPMILDQWFLDMPQVQKRAIEIIQNNEIELIPENFKSIYMEYMTKIEPWCISRQISWGHKIPAWYDEDGKVYVGRSYKEVVQKSGKDKLTQDSDVLDTWFSSALWPMLTLGWPDKELSQPFYPNEFLVTGHDILFFWATKMIVMHIGLFGNTGVPFKSIKLHGLVQDECGLKMSKSKGNVVDPLALCEEYGTDILSFALIYTASTGHNIKFGSQNIEKSKKFLNKIWNALNFALKNLSKEPVPITNEINTYIIKKCHECEQLILQKIKEWDMYNAADALYNFFWDDFCSWHIEVAKYLNNSEFSQETSFTLYYLVRKLLKIMHPFLPVITEYFWQEMGEHSDLLYNYSEIQIELNQSKECQINTYKLRKIISRIRAIKDKFQLQNTTETYLSDNIDEQQLQIINSITKNNILHDTKTDSTNLVKFSFEGVVFKVEMQIDPNELDAKFAKIISDIERNVQILQKQLTDPGFISHAAPDLIKEKQIQLKEFENDLKIYSESRKNRK